MTGRRGAGGLAPLAERVARYLADCAAAPWLDARYHPTADGAVKLVRTAADDAAAVRLAFDDLTAAGPPPALDLAGLADVLAPLGPMALDDPDPERGGQVADPAVSQLAPDAALAAISDLADPGGAERGPFPASVLSLTGDKLRVCGAVVAEGVTADSVVTFGRQVFAHGRQVAAVPADERNSPHA